MINCRLLISSIPVTSNTDISVAHIMYRSRIFHHLRRYEPLFLTRPIDHIFIPASIMKISKHKILMILTHVFLVDPIVGEV